MTPVAPPARIFDWATLVVQLIGVAILFIYTRYTAKIWKVNKRSLAATDAALEETRKSNCATEKSNEIAQDALELGRRAWLVAANLEPPRQFYSDGRIAILKLTIENIGATPAAAVEVFAFADIQASIPERMPSAPLLVSVGALGHGRHLDVPVSVGGLTPVNHEALQAGTLKLYFYCRIVYKDWFAKARLTETCWQYEAGRWVIAAKHNHLT